MNCQKARSPIETGIRVGRIWEHIKSAPKLNKVHKNISNLLWRNIKKYDRIILGFFSHLG